jgi:hypothetical protein
VSRWFPEQLHIELAPDQVVVERRTMALSLTGLRPRRQQRQVLATGAAAGRGAWTGALRGLATALAEQGGGRCAVTVILANSLVRYALVPRSDLLNVEQEAAVLQHCFNEIYGPASEHWALRISAAPGLPLQVASGVDRALLAELRSLFPDDRLRLRSVQPRLMAVCNAHRAALGSRLGTAPAWLLLVEPGNLCLGLIAAGGLARLRGMRCGSDWATELPWVLEREACLAELEEAPGEVLLWQRDGAASPVPDTGALRLRRLLDPQPGPLPAEVAGSEEQLAVAGR